MSISLYKKIFRHDPESKILRTKVLLDSEYNDYYDEERKKIQENNAKQI